MIEREAIPALYANAEGLARSGEHRSAIEALRVILDHTEPIVREETDEGIFEPYQGTPSQLAAAESRRAGGKPLVVVMDYFTAALYMSGYCFAALGEFEEARRYLDEAAGLWPENATVRLELAFVCGKLDLFDTAVAVLQEAADANPGDARVHRELAWFHNRKGHHDAAVRCAREAVRIEPGLLKAHEELLFAFENLGLETEADAVKADIRRIVAAG